MLHAFSSWCFGRILKSSRNDTASQDSLSPFLSISTIRLHVQSTAPEVDGFRIELVPGSCARDMHLALCRIATCAIVRMQSRRRKAWLAAGSVVGKGMAGGQQIHLEDNIRKWSSLAFSPLYPNSIILPLSTTPLFVPFISIHIEFDRGLHFQVLVPQQAATIALISLAL